MTVLAVIIAAWLAHRPAPDPRCDGPARYDAMCEAYERGKPNPCASPPHWRGIRRLFT